MLIRLSLKASMHTSGLPAHSHFWTIKKRQSPLQKSFRAFFILKGNQEHFQDQAGEHSCGQCRRKAARRCSSSAGSALATGAATAANLRVRAAEPSGLWAPPASNWAPGRPQQDFKRRLRRRSANSRLVFPRHRGDRRGLPLPQATRAAPRGEERRERQLGREWPRPRRCQTPLLHPLRARVPASLSRLFPLPEPLGRGAGDAASSRGSPGSPGRPWGAPGRSPPPARSRGSVPSAPLPLSTSHEPCAALVGFPGPSEFPWPSPARTLCKPLPSSLRLLLPGSRADHNVPPPWPGRQIRAPLRKALSPAGQIQPSLPWWEGFWITEWYGFNNNETSNLQNSLLRRVRCFCAEEKQTSQQSAAKVS